MIKLIYEQKEEYIDDEYFPETKAELIFDDEVTSTGILINTIKLLKFAGYSLPSEEYLNDFKEELDHKGLLRR